jgi:hypothetical protein
MSLKLAERFESHFKKSEGCWIWLGAFDRCGYGHFQDHMAHRFAYELYAGPIPEGMELHHTCGTRLCVNPGHLEVVTRAEHKEIPLRGIKTKTQRAMEELRLRYEARYVR